MSVLAEAVAGVVAVVVVVVVVLVVVVVVVVVGSKSSFMHKICMNSVVPAENKCDSNQSLSHKF